MRKAANNITVKREKKMIFYFLHSQCKLDEAHGHEGCAHTFHPPSHMCVCECVFQREREREREIVSAVTGDSFFLACNVTTM